MNLHIAIYSGNLQGDGFAEFWKNSVKEMGLGLVIVDLNAMLNCVTDNPEISFKQIFSESVVHEILHAVQELFGKSFKEKEIEMAIEKARNFIGND